MTPNLVICLQFAGLSLDHFFSQLQQVVDQVVNDHVSPFDCALFGVGANEVVFNPLVKERTSIKNVFWNIFLIEAAITRGTGKRI